MEQTPTTRTPPRLTTRRRPRHSRTLPTSWIYGAGCGGPTRPPCAPCSQPRKPTAWSPSPWWRMSPAPTSSSEASTNDSTSRNAPSKRASTLWTLSRPATTRAWCQRWTCTRRASNSPAPRPPSRPSSGCGHRQKTPSACSWVDLRCRFPADFPSMIKCFRPRSRPVCRRSWSNAVPTFARPSSCWPLKRRASASPRRRVSRP